MHAVDLCLILLALNCGASLLSRVVPVPLPFLQIAIGIVAALPPFGLRATLDPQTFLLLFIPPLLFADGWSLPRRELTALRWPVFGHAVGLVLLTVLVGGYGLHWLIPAMPLSVGFAVAALVSPTDAVAVSAITRRIRVPGRMMHLLESEALLNDATGLVAMRFAVAATLSGGFSPTRAAGAFVLIATGGLAIGWLLTLAYARLHHLLLVRAQDATVQTVLTGLLPYAAYGLAEQVGASGILAAVAAGIAASWVGLLEPAHFSARMQTGTTWGVVSFCLNGIVFVLLGLQLPGIIGSGPVGIDLLTSDRRLAVLGEIGLLTALLIVLRLLWVLASGLLGRTLRGNGDGGIGNDWRVIAASSLAGVRGAVTLAGVLSLPLLVPGGAPFPSRDLAITLATGVILCSMLIASIGLPLLLRHARHDDHTGRELRMGRIAAIDAAISAISTDRATPGPRETALIDTYRQRLDVLRGQTEPSDTVEDNAWRDLYQTALRAEREAVQELRTAGDINDIVARQLLGDIDVIEAALTRRPFGLHPAQR